MTITETKQQLRLFENPAEIRSWLDQHRDEISPTGIAYVNFRIYTSTPKEKRGEILEKKETDFSEIFDDKLLHVN